MVGQGSVSDLFGQIVMYGDEVSLADHGGGPTYDIAMFSEGALCRILAKFAVDKVWDFRDFLLIAYRQGREAEAMSPQFKLEKHRIEIGS